MKKGFTLAEILAVVVIMGLLVLLIAPSLINKIKTKEKSVESTQNTIIYDAANLYMDKYPEKYVNAQGNAYCIPFKTLIKEGYLTEDLTDVTDTDNEDYQDNSVTVTIGENGVREYAISKNCSEKETRVISINVGPVDNEVWSKYKYAEIIFPNIGTNYNMCYSQDNGQTWNASKKIQKTSNISMNNTTVRAIGLPSAATCNSLNGMSEETRKNNALVTEKEVTLTNIDNTAPTCTLTPTGTEGTHGWFRSNVTVKVSGLDTGESTIAKTGVSLITKTSYEKQELIQTKDTEGTYYYGYVKDKAGNVGTCKLLIKKDATNPTITSVSNSSNSAWTNKNITISASAKDDTSGIEHIKYYYDSDSSNMGCNWNGPYNCTFNNVGKTLSVTGEWIAERNQQVTIVATDKAGNQTTKSAGYVRIDKTAPTCSMYKGSCGTSGCYVGANYSDSGSGVADSDSDAGTYKSSGNYSCSVTDNAGNSGSGTNYISISPYSACGEYWYGCLGYSTTTSCNPYVYWVCDVPQYEGNYHEEWPDYGGSCSTKAFCSCTSHSNCSSQTECSEYGYDWNNCLLPYTSYQ